MNSLNSSQADSECRVVMFFADSGGADFDIGTEIEIILFFVPSFEVAIATIAIFRKNNLFMDFHVVVFHPWVPIPRQKWAWIRTRKH